MLVSLSYHIYQPTAKIFSFCFSPADTKREGECFSDELDTMDLYKLLELKESNETNKVEKSNEKERNE